MGVRENLDQIQEEHQKDTRQADSPATPRKTREANPVSDATCVPKPKTEERKADAPARAAGEEKPRSVEEQKRDSMSPTPPVGEPNPSEGSHPKEHDEAANISPRMKPWPEADLARARASVAALLGYEPSEGFEKSIMLRMRGRPAIDFLELLNRKWQNRKCRPGGKWAPQNENWFFAVIESEFSPAIFPSSRRRCGQSIKSNQRRWPWRWRRWIPSASPCCGDSVILYVGGKIKNCRCGGRRSARNRKQPVRTHDSVALARLQRRVGDR